MNKHRVRTVVLSAFATGSLIIGTGAIGQTALNDVLNEGISATKIAQESQVRVDTIVDETDKIVTQYKTVLKTVEDLKVYNAQLDRSIARQLVEMEKLTNSTKEVTNTKRQIVPLLVKMTDALEAFIKNDIPFRYEERLAGIERLKDLMDNPDVEASEKFRSIFEAYQIESDYGRAFQSYKQKVNVDGQERDVDMLMVGRVALLYQTSDGSVSAAYNKETKQFDEVDEGTYKNSIATAMRVANQTLAADRLIGLPISAPETAQ
jgi:hypothetical protein